MKTDHWNSIQGLDGIDSPGLLIDVDLVERNIQSMIDCVGGQAQRLRPHVKTTKSTQIIRMCVDAGITLVKAATINESRAAAQAGCQSVLLAHQPVGIKRRRLRELVDEFPSTRFAAVVDCPSIASDLSEVMSGRDETFPLWMDIDCGMHRTGIPLGEDSAKLQKTIDELPNVCFGGLHVYDGHIHDPPLDARRARALPIIESIRAYTQSHPAPAIVCSGSPTFRIFADETDYQCGPGTTVLWDVGYGRQYPDLPFDVAAALLTRVISRPGQRQWCLDCGYKSLASEMSLDTRMILPKVPDAVFIGQSEEHMVIESDQTLEIGQELIALPKHICPTVALHASATVIRDGRVTDEKIEIDARDR